MDFKAHLYNRCGPFETFTFALQEGKAGQPVLFGKTDVARGRSWWRRDGAGQEQREQLALAIGSSPPEKPH